MRISSVQADAFGPFIDQRLDLGEGMTVVWGPNEAGKSSWHAAIYAGLCGMRRGRGARRKDDQAFMARHKPWDLNEWRIRADVECDDGRKLTFDHELIHQVDCSVRDAVTGRDVSNEYIHDGSPDGATLLGLTRETVPVVLSVRQSEILRVLGEPENLQEFLQRAAATGGADATAEEAIQIIQSFRTDKIGSDRRNSTKPLRRAIESADAAEKKLADVREQHEELVRLMEERDQKVEEAARAEGDFRQVRAATLRRRVDELGMQVDRVKAFDQEFAAGPPPEDDPEREKRERVDRALAAWDAKPEMPDEPETPLAAELKGEAEGLPPAPPIGDTEPDRRVLGAREAWTQAVTKFEAHHASSPEGASEVPDVAVSPAELRHLADQLERAIPTIASELENKLSDPASGTRSLGLALFAAVTGVIAGGALFTFGEPVAGTGVAAATLLVAAVLYLRRNDRVNSPEVLQLQTRLMLQWEQHEQARAARAAAEKQAAELNLEPDPQLLRDTARRMDNSEAEQKRFSDWTTRKNALEAEVGEATTCLRDVLIEKGVDVTRHQGLEGAYQQHRDECRGRADALKAHERRKQLLEQAEYRGRAELAYRDAVDLNKSAEQALRETALGLGMAEDEPQAIATALRAYRAESEDCSQAWQGAWGRWNELQGTLEGKSPEDLNDEVTGLRKELENLPDPGSLLGAEGLDDLLAEFEQQAAEARRDADRLNGQVEDRRQRSESVSQAEEELSEAKSERTRVQELDRLTNATLEFLRAARDRVQRDIAPRLGVAIESRLPRITGSRYSEVTVDPATLQIRVKARGGAMRDATRLSHGTAEQIYLLLRIALSEQLVTTDETAPLILDDVSVQSDRGRTIALLDLLHEISADRQVVLFSQEDEVRTWAEENLVIERDRFVSLDAVDP